MLKGKKGQDETNSLPNWVSCRLQGQQWVCARESVAGEVCTDTCFLPLLVSANL